MSWGSLRGLLEASMLTLVWDWSHGRQQHPATIPAPVDVRGQDPTSLPGCSQTAASGLTSSPPGAGLFFKVLQGHGLLLPISSEGQLRPSRNSSSLASAGFPSAPENTVPSRQAASLQIRHRFGAVPVMSRLVSGPHTARVVRGPGMGGSRCRLW